MSLMRAWKHDRWVKPYLGRYKKVLAAALVLGIAALLFNAALMFFSGYLLSASAEKPYSVFELLVPLGLVQFFGVGRPFLNYLERLVSHDWVLRLTSSLRLRLYQAIARDPLHWSAVQRTGDVLGLLSDDIAHIQNLYLRCIFPTVLAWAGWLVMLAVIGRLSLLYLLIMLVATGVLVFVVPLLSVLVNGARQARGKELEDELYARVTDDVLGATDWALSGRAQDCVQAVSDICEQARELRERTAAFDRRRDCVVYIIFSLLSVLICVWAAWELGGTQPAFDPDISFNARNADWIAAFVLGFFPLVDAFVPLSAGATEARTHAHSIVRLNELDAKTGKAAVVDHGADPVVDHGADPGADLPPDLVADPAVHPAAELAGTGTPRLVLDNVGFSYTDPQHPGATQTPVLSGINLTLEPGEHLALLGASGSGKSTLLSLIRGDLRPSSGTVGVDGIPTCSLGPAASKVFAVVQQNTHLFHTTLLDNMRVACPHATEDQVVAALEALRLGPLLASLPQGVHTMVDEGGLRFSGGERHRLALARVLLQDAPIIMLDEPFAALDPYTEGGLIDTLLDAFAQRSVILVTHHLLGINRMDRVVFISDGTIEMQGAPAELERTEQRFRQLLAFDRGE